MKKLSVPVILDVKLHYFGSLGLVYYSYNQETYRFFRRLSSGCTVQRQARSKRGRGEHKSGRGRRKFFARFARTMRRTPLHNILHPPLVLVGGADKIKAMMSSMRSLMMMTSLMSELKILNLNH